MSAQQVFWATLAISVVGQVAFYYLMSRWIKRNSAKRRNSWSEQPDQRDFHFIPEHKRHGYPPIMSIPRHWFRKPVQRTPERVARVPHV